MTNELPLNHRFNRGVMSRRAVSITLDLLRASHEPDLTREELEQNLRDGGFRIEDEPKHTQDKP